MTSLRINWILPRTNLTGGVKVARALAEELDRRGHRSTLVCLRPRTSWLASWRVRALARTLIRETRLIGRERHFLEGTRLPVIEIDDERVKPNQVPDSDVTIATWWETMEWVSTWPASKGLKAHLVQHYELHGGDPERVRAAYRTPALRIAVSRWLQKLMQEEFGQTDTVLVPNGIDFAQFDAPPRGKAEQPTVGFMYSQRSWKRSALAMEAIRRARREEPALRAVSFGADALERGAQLPPRTRFWLRPAQHRIAAIYRACDAWLLTSSLEGFGLPGLEAAACRCPVVSTRCGGPEDYIEDGVSGYLVPTEDPEALARALLSVLHQPDGEWRQMSDAAYAIARRFSWERAGRLLEEALIRYSADHRSRTEAEIPRTANHDSREAGPERDG